jgi:hypothetical protein
MNVLTGFVAKNVSWPVSRTHRNIYRLLNRNYGVPLGIPPRRESVFFPKEKRTISCASTLVTCNHVGQ